MDISELRKRIEKRVQETLPSRLMERYKRSHMKRQWRDCDCSYCEEKRKNHQYLQYAPFSLSYERKQEWRASQIKHCRAALANEVEKVIS